MIKDIQSKQDIDDLVRSFYQEAFDDELIGHIFTEIAELDLESHLPTIVSFWAQVLLLEGGYSGNIIRKHVDINHLFRLEEKHFERWLVIWEEQVNSKFKGPKAEEAITRARTMKAVILFKIRKSEEPGFIA